MPGFPWGVFMIGLKELLDLVDIVEVAEENLGSTFHSIRVLACDVMEMQLLSGNNVEVEEGRNMIGVTQDPETSLMLINSDRKDELGLVAHIIPNGVLEIHVGRWLGGIAPWEGVDLSGKVEKPASSRFIWVLFGVKKDDSVEQMLFCYYSGSWVSAHKLTYEDSNDEKPEWWKKIFDTEECLHSFRNWGRSGFGDRTKILDCCEYCGEDRERPAEPDEQMVWDSKTHNVAHMFEAHMSPDMELLVLETQGFEEMKKAETFADEHPDDVQIVGVDDASFSSSFLVLVNRRDDEEFMGTTVYYIPQNAGTGAEFFLYGQHRKGLIKALKLIEKQQAAYPQNPLND